ncbi:MAG: zinc ribbon domain-containing protein [Thermoplasmata archaeon]|nr:zinc ribbon domain-containing protein [Thermoplasmata archaeon]
MNEARAITRSVLRRPRYTNGRWRVAGPDEDVFTLAVGALEVLDPTAGDEGQGPRRIHLLSADPELDESMFASATGAVTPELRRYPATAVGAVAALDAAAAPAPSGSIDLVVAVDTPATDDEDRGTATVGLRIEAAPGLEVGEHLHVAAPEGDELVPAEVLERARPLLGPESDRLPAFWVLFPDETPTGWTDLWAEHAPRSGWDATAPASDLGRAPATGLLTLIHRAHDRWTDGTRGVVGSVEASDVSLVELRRTGGGARAGRIPDIESMALLPLAEGTSLGRPRLDAVSEGAYVPRATYLDNLAARWRLSAERCGECASVTFPPRHRCRTCGRDDRLTRAALPRHGLEVAAVTTIAPGAQPTEFDPLVDRRGAYSVVVVDVAPGVRVTAQVTDAVAGSLTIGDRVDLELRRLYPMEGTWRYGLKAVPAPGARR